MRKRKVASVIEEEESVQNHGHNNQNENEDCEGNGFFACYLLTSLSPRFKGHTYIGFLSHLISLIFTKIQFWSLPFTRSKNHSHPFGFSFIQIMGLYQFLWFLFHFKLVPLWSDDPLVLLVFFFFNQIFFGRNVGYLTILFLRFLLQLL